MKYFDCHIFSGSLFGGTLFYFFPTIELFETENEFGIVIMILFWRIVFTWYW